MEKSFFPNQIVNFVIYKLIDIRLVEAETASQFADDVSFVAARDKIFDQSV